MSDPVVVLHVILWLIVTFAIVAAVVLARLGPLPLTSPVPEPYTFPAAPKSEGSRETGGLDPAPSTDSQEPTSYADKCGRRRDDGPTPCYMCEGPCTFGGSSLYGRAPGLAEALAETRASNAEKLERLNGLGYPPMSEGDADYMRRKRQPATAGYLTLDGEYRTEMQRAHAAGRTLQEQVLYGDALGNVYRAPAPMHERRDPNPIPNTTGRDALPARMDFPNAH